MTITLELSPEREARLRELAAARGLDLAGLVMQAVMGMVGAENLANQENSPAGDADPRARWSTHVGVLRGRGELSGADAKRVYGEALLEKHTKRSR